MWYAPKSDTATPSARSISTRPVVAEPSTFGDVARAAAATKAVAHPNAGRAAKYTTSSRAIAERAETSRTEAALTPPHKRDVSVAAQSKRGGLARYSESPRRGTM